MEERISMDFGMPTLIELDSLAETIELCVNSELKFIELNMNMPQYQLDKLTLLDLHRYKNSSVYFTIYLDENLNVWDFNPLVTKAYFGTVLSSIMFAAEMDIPILNMHLNMHMNNGVYFTLPDQKIFL